MTSMAPFGTWRELGEARSLHATVTVHCAAPNQRPGLVAFVATEPLARVEKDRIIGAGRLSFSDRGDEPFTGSEPVRFEFNHIRMAFPSTWEVVLKLDRVMSTAKLSNDNGLFHGFGVTPWFSSDREAACHYVVSFAGERGAG